MRRWCPSICASDDSMRRKSCSRDISRLNTPTVNPVWVPTCCAMFSASDVFPIDGRAAMMMRSPRWNPDVRLSRSLNPVGTPVISFFSSCAFWMASTLSCASSSSDTNPRRMPPSAIWKIEFSARSRISAASWSAS